MSKIVVTADVHLHPYRICSRDGGHDRLLDGLSCLRQSLDLARAEKAIWVMLGDFKKPKTLWPQDALTGSLAVLREYDDVIKVMLAGNHDARGLDGSGLSPFKNVAHVVEEPSVVVAGDQMFVCAPWDADRSRVSKILEDARNVGENLPLLAHGFLAGVLLGLEDARLVNKGIPLEEYGLFPVAFFGDIHKGQQLVRAQNRPPAWMPLHASATAGVAAVRSAGRWRGDVFYPGSPYQQDWGERNDGAKGALLVDLVKGVVQLHILNAPRFHHFEVDADGLAAIDFGALFDDFVRVVYTGKPCAALDDLRGAVDRFRSLEIILRRVRHEETRVNIRAGMGDAELLAKYMEAKPPPDGVDREQIRKAFARIRNGT